MEQFQIIVIVKSKGDLNAHDPIKMHRSPIDTDGMRRPNFGRISIIYFHLISYPSMFGLNIAINSAFLAYCLVQTYAGIHVNQGQYLTAIIY